MNSHSIALLEFRRVLEQLAAYCFSATGREAVQVATFFSSSEELLSYRKKVDALHKIEWNPRVHDLADISIIFQDRDEPLSLSACFLLLGYLNNIKQLISSLRKLELPFMLREADYPQQLHRRLKQCFTEDGELHEDCHPQYKKLGSRMAQCRKKIATLARSYIIKYPAAFQNDQGVLRNERTVLPLSSTHRHLIGGIIHGRSSSASTIFIEPPDLLEENNRLTELREEEYYIIQTLRRELSTAIVDAQDELRHLDDGLAELDSCYARYIYGRQNKAVFAEISERIVLHQLRHPLVQACKPLDISMSADFLLVTGPNAGGKTVLLKAVGLSILMQQSAIPIPAREGSSLPLYKMLFVEIGDEQSIDAGLSTFSAKMTSIAEILRAINSQSDRQDPVGQELGHMVIIDEFGSATDPEEGSALVIAIIDALRKTGSHIICSSHIGILKAYALNTGQCLSMAFDADKHRPIYRVIEGVAEGSHAIDTAERCGIPPTIVAEARSYHEANKSRQSSLIAELSEQIARLRAERKEFAEQAADLERKQQSWEEESGKRANEQQQEHEADLKRMRNFLHEKSILLENLVRELREGQITGNKTKEVRLFLDEAREEIADEEENLQEKRKKLKTSDQPLSLSQGMPVLLKRNNKQAVVESIIGSGRIVILLDNGMRFTCKPEEIEIQQTKIQKPEVSIDVQARHAPSTLDLRGCMVDEAIARCDQALNRLLLSGNKTLTIIHGIGTGALRKALNDYFSVHSQILRVEQHSTGGAMDIILHA